MDLKLCKKCQKERPVESFERGTGFSRSVCNECVNAGRRHRYHHVPGAKAAKLAADALYYKKNRPDIRKKETARALKRRYKLTPEQVEEMRKRQSGKCAICERVVKLHVDHNHTTKKVRELLCPNCNKALGLLKDSPAIALSAAAYLKKHECAEEGIKTCG